LRLDLVSRLGELVPLFLGRFHAQRLPLSFAHHNNERKTESEFDHGTVQKRDRSLQIFNRSAVFDRPNCEPGFL
jgi:hypothetical protein